MNAETLVLDRSYRPVQVVSWEDAITMLFSGKAEVIHEYDAEVRSAYLVIKVPAVVRLLKWFRRERKPVKFSRVNIYARDGYACQYCGHRPRRMEELTYDHVLPRAQGGKTEWSNIATACGPCNARKSNRTPQQAGMKLRKQPRQPDDQPAIMIRLSRQSVPDAWRDYLYWTAELDEG